MDGHASSYHRFFSKARWSLWPLGRILAGLVLAWVPKDQVIVIDADDTVAQHKGKKVFGKGCHRDPVRSSQRTTVLKWGHRWVVLAVNVRLPFCQRDWALPVLAALYTQPQNTPSKRNKSVKDGKSKKKAKRGRKKGQRVKIKPQGRSRLPDRSWHKTPPLLVRQMLAALLHWFPDRRFILLVDGGLASHDLAWFCRRHAERVTLVGRLRCDANLYALPAAAQQRRRGRRTRKGRKLATPQQTVARAGKMAQVHVRWYGNRERDLEILSAAGGWYRGRGGGRAELIPIRWVCVRGTSQDDYFYSTDPTLLPTQIIEIFAGRWNIEVTFEEMRAHLGFETTRMRREKSVKRAGAMLFGLFSVVSLIYGELAREKKVKVYSTPCYHKTDPTFADALAAVRRLFWETLILKHVHGVRHVAKLPPPMRNLLLDHLAAAA